MVHAASANREVVGDQTYVPEPAEGVAVNVTLAPTQIAASLLAIPEVSVAETVTDGAEVSVTVAEAGALAQLPEE